MTQLTLLPNVSLKGTQSPLVVGLMILQGVASNLGIPELILTHVSDGRHSAKSFHYAGLAADIRSHNLTNDQKKALLRAFSAAAGAQFDFILEDQGLPNEHFHLEYDEHA